MGEPSLQKCLINGVKSVPDTRNIFNPRVEYTNTMARDFTDQRNIADYNGGLREPKDWRSQAPPRTEQFVTIPTGAQQLDNVPDSFMPPRSDVKDFSYNNMDRLRPPIQSNIEGFRKPETTPVDISSRNSVDRTQNDCGNRSYITQPFTNTSLYAAPPDNCVDRTSTATQRLQLQVMNTPTGLPSHALAANATNFNRW
jgi:hypothetical protein